MSVSGMVPFFIDSVDVFIYKLVQNERKNKII